MSSSEKRQERSEFETLRSRIETRESSTLTFSTVTTSASFVILSLLVSLKALPQVLYIIGALFSLIGIFYRELTVFSVDHVERMELRRLEEKVMPDIKIPSPHWSTFIVRGFLVRVYLYLGFFSWPMLLFPTLSLLFSVATVIIPMVITVIQCRWESKGVK